MASDIPGISGISGSSVIPTTPSVGRVAPSRALVPLAPAEPRPASTAGTPLDRSGLDLQDLFDTLDLVATRPRTPSVALEVGLEQARGMLLRSLPSEALAALDGVWDGARRTEEGWFLRSGALTVLGLPGESDRVAEQGLASRPSSAALRFLQSVARLAVGDVVGARTALQPALQGAPNDPLLIVQQAVVHARQGDARGADALLQRAMRAAPDHPAIEYGRVAVRAATADVARVVSRLTPQLGAQIVEGTALSEAQGGAPPSWPKDPPQPKDPTPENADANARIETHGDGRSPGPGTEQVTASKAPGIHDDAFNADGPPAATTERARDVVDSALRGVGARIVQGSSNDVVREVRLLVRAFSAGGTLAPTASAEQSHAARILLTTLASVLSGNTPDAPQPLRTAMQSLLASLREGRVNDAARTLRKAGAVMREPSVRLLEMVVDGALHELSRSGRGPERGPMFTPTASTVVVRGVAEQSPVVPVRLGLALLDENAASRATMRAIDSGNWPAVMYPDGRSDMRFDGRRDPLAEMGEVTGNYSAVSLVEDGARGWGAAQATAGLRAPEALGELTAGAGVRAVALLCVALAAGAMSTGHTVIAIALGIGAAWLALRRSGREGRRSGRDQALGEQPPDHPSEGRR